jgi:hypothetical protein
MPRTWGRVPPVPGGKPTIWVEVSTDPNGNNDGVWLTTLAQTLLLNLGESPFNASLGIPAVPDVMQQVFPDYYVTQIQQIYAPYFASLKITKRATSTPTYDILAITHQGVVLSKSVSPTSSNIPV